MRRNKYSHLYEMINKHFSEPAHYWSPNFGSDTIGAEAKQIS